MDMHTVDSVTNWSQVWMVPAVVSLVAGLLFAVLFKVVPAEGAAADTPDTAK